MMLEGTESSNAQAVKELFQYLEIQKMKQLPTSMGDIQKRYQAIPYGWREVDIAVVTAELIAAQKIQVKYGGAVIQPGDQKMPDYLRKRAEIDKAIIGFRVVPPTALIKKCREFLSEYHNCTLGVIPDDENGLIGYMTEKFETERDALYGLLSEEYGAFSYPGKNVVENGVKLCDALLSCQKDPIALLHQAVDMQEDFLDHAEDMSDVNTFFRVQKPIFDSTRAQIELVNAEKE